jgi:exodeoxyribonuclease-5
MNDTTATATATAMATATATVPASSPSKTISPNPDQVAAIDALLTYISDPAPDTEFFVFSGYAGTGKTFCMREVVARCSKSRVKFAFTAPTNKAAKELKKVTGSACTIFSLLGLRIDKSGEVKYLVAGKAPTDLSDIDVIFIDEAGMVNKNLMAILQQQCEKFQVKVVFMGDIAQLPPVGESHSPVWDEPVNVKLTKVMRHDNQILTLVTEIREVLNSIAPSINIRNNNDGSQGVWKMTKAEFKESIYNAAVAGGFADGSAGKVIAWRNARVEEYNDIIRHAIFGAEATRGTYMIGDRIVAASPCVRGDEQLLSTDEEALVESVAACKHPLESKYNAFELRCRTETNKIIRLLVIHPSSKAQFDNDSQLMAHDAKGNGRLWKKFWEHKDLFHDVKYAYALTTHRSQGSTYTNVWVDYQDILMNRNRKEAFQCLYVASSRPTTKLCLA